MPRDCFDVLGVDQQHFKVVLQNIEDRFPILTGALHGHMRDTMLHQPIRQCQQLNRHCSKRACLLVQSPLGIRNNDGGHNGLLVYVQTSTMSVNYVHSNLSWAIFLANVDAHRSESDLRAHLTVATIGGAFRHPGQTSHQAHGTSY